MGDNRSEDFTDVVAKAQRVDKDMGNLFGTNPARVAFEPQRRNAGPELDYDAHVKVFALPADASDYEDVLNMALRGEALIRFERDTFTKDGDFMVAVCYLTPRDRPQAAPDQDAGDAEPVVRPQRLP